jgi:phage recombination protein Bet
MSKQENLPAIVSDKFTSEEITLLRETYAKGLNDTQLRVFLKQCDAMDLSPFTKEIYGMVIGGKLVLITSINGLRKIAHKSGCYAGCSVDYEYDDKGKVTAAIAVVKKIVQGHMADFRYRALTKEYSTGQNNWKTMETVMISKCAEAGAIRMAFSTAENLYEESEIGAIGKDARRSERALELTERFKYAPSREAAPYPSTAPEEIELEPETKDETNAQ